MSDLIYYCIESNNDCPRCNECERYLDSKLHNSKTTLFKNACTEENNRILFIEANKTDNNDEIKEDDSTEQTT